MNQCQLQIFLDFRSSIDNECMSVSIEHANNISTVLPQEETVFCYETSIILPCRISLSFGNKKNGKDTTLDEYGNIIKDKCVIITDLKLDGLSVDPLYLVRHLELTHSGGPSWSNYVGFNGEMVIDFKYNNVFNQILHFKRLGQR